MKINKIICCGEILWDSMPAGLFLGGAPINVAVHLKHLDNKVEIISRVGNDELGNEILRRIQRYKINTGLIQIDKDYQTGFVRVDLKQKDNPKYDIVKPVAWDFIEEPAVTLDEKMIFVFGSLAQRSTVSAKTIEKLSGQTPYTVFDINLRPPYDSKETVEKSLQKTWLAKLNDAELEKLQLWFNLPDNIEEACGKLNEIFGCQIICITKGNKGADIWSDNNFSSIKGHEIEVRNTVGAGDAFLAGLLDQIIQQKPLDQCLKFANAFGALVATKEGATPEIDRESIHSVIG